MTIHDSNNIIGWVMDNWMKSWIRTLEINYINFKQLYTDENSYAYKIINKLKF